MALGGNLHNGIDKWKVESKSGFSSPTDRTKAQDDPALTLVNRMEAFENHKEDRQKRQHDENDGPPRT